MFTANEAREAFNKYASNRIQILKQRGDEIITEAEKDIQYRASHGFEWTRLNFPRDCAFDPIVRSYVFDILLDAGYEVEQDSMVKTAFLVKWGNPTTPIPT